MRNNINDNSRTYAYLLIAAAVFFVFNRWFGFIRLDIGSLWPLFILVPGAGFLYAAHTGDKGQAGLYFPGMIITGTGAILLYQMWSGHWESWAYVWTIYPALIGMAMELHGRRVGDHPQMRMGSEMMRWSLMAFGVGFFFFEILIFNHQDWLPLLLIAGALFLLFRRPLAARNDDYSADAFPFKSKRDDVLNGYSKAKRDLGEQDERIN